MRAHTHTHTHTHTHVWGLCVEAVQWSESVFPSCNKSCSLASVQGPVIFEEEHCPLFCFTVMYRTRVIMTQYQDSYLNRLLMCHYYKEHLARHELGDVYFSLYSCIYWFFLFGVSETYPNLLFLHLYLSLSRVPCVLKSGYLLDGSWNWMVLACCNRVMLKLGCVHRKRKGLPVVLLINMVEITVCTL